MKSHLKEYIEIVLVMLACKAVLSGHSFSYLLGHGSRLHALVSKILPIQDLTKVSGSVTLLHCLVLALIPSPQEPEQSDHGCQSSQAAIKSENATE